MSEAHNNHQRVQTQWRGPLRVLFMGTPAFALPSLERLVSWSKSNQHAPLSVVGVVSQPARPKGRGQRLEQTPIGTYAEANALPLYQWPKLKNESFEALSALHPDLIVVIAYGKILPKRYLELAPLGCWNLHGSILPALRGAAPVQWALLHGLKETGVSLMQLDEGMDTGPVGLQKSCPIEAEEDASALFEKLSLLSADVLEAGLEALYGAGLPFLEQDAEEASYAPLLKKEDGEIDWSRPAQRIADQVRGLSVWPGSWSTSSLGRIKVAQVRVVEGEGQPGELLEPLPEGPRVACGTQALCLERLQRPGRKLQSGAEFLRGAVLPVGEVLT